MSPEHERAPRGRALERIVARFRLRAYLVGALRVVLASSGGLALSLVVLGAIVGPIVSRPLALAAWGAAALVGILAGLASARGAGGLLGDDAVRLIARVDKRLAEAARSALELSRTPSGSASEGLVDAHLARVVGALEGARPDEALPLWPSLSRPAIVCALGLVSLGGALASDGRAGAGVMALARAPLHEDEGFATGEVVRSYEVDVVPPSYREEPALRGLTTPHLEVLEGSTLRFRIEGRVEATAAVLRVGARRIDLSRTSTGAFHGAATIDEGGPVLVRMRTRGGEWIEDLRGRSIRVAEDPLPEVALESVLGESSSERIVVRWSARDDHGLAEVRLVTEVEGLPPTRRRLSDEGASKESKRGIESIDPRELGAEPGDTLTLVLEARDHKPPPEARFARSAPVVVTLPSPETERQRHLSLIEEALDYTLDALADRLEVPRSHPIDEKRERRALSSTGLVPPSVERALEAVSGADAPLLRRFLRALQRPYERETVELTRKAPREGALRKHEEALVEALREGGLLLDDLRAKARLADFEEVALELERLRREMASLLAEYARTRDPEVKRALTRALKRAKKKLDGLRERMAASGSDVPREFVNAGAEPRAASEETLEKLEAALTSDSLEDAEATLLELERELHAMAEAFGSGSAEVAESRFGPRQRALAEAIERVRGLEAEEGELAREHAALRRALAERALSELGETQKVAEREEVGSAIARALESLEEMEGGASAFTDEDTITRIAGRVRDVREALAQGDLGEAAKMAREARHDAVALERELSLRATMFPGRRGEIREAAEEAQRLAETVAGLAAEVERSIPDLDAHIRPSDESGLERLSERHRAVERAAAEVAEHLAEGPDGTPLSEEGADELRRAASWVERGARAAAERDAITSGESASRAAEALRRVRELLEEHRRNPSSGESGGGRAGGAEREERVTIPGREGRPESERQRRIRDGLRRDAPDEYRDSVKRYFEALLR